MELSFPERLVFFTTDVDALRLELDLLQDRILLYLNLEICIFVLLLVEAIVVLHVDVIVEGVHVEVFI